MVIEPPAPRTIRGAKIELPAMRAAPAFASSFRALGQKLFPSYEFAPLPETHPIYTNQMFDRAKWKRKPVIFSQRNGARELMILLPTATRKTIWRHEPSKGP